MGRGERWTVGLTVVLALMLSIAGGAIAAKGGNGGGKGKGAVDGTSTLALVPLEDDGEVNFGDWVTFDVRTTATDRPFVSVKCWHEGVWVYSASAGFFPDYPWDRDFILSSDAWPGGPGECTARLFMTKDGSRSTTLATLDFHVAA